MGASGRALGFAAATTSLPPVGANPAGWNHTLEVRARSWDTLRRYESDGSVPPRLDSRRSSSGGGLVWSVVPGQRLARFVAESRWEEISDEAREQRWASTWIALKFAGGSFTLMPEKALGEMIEIAHDHYVLVSTGGFIEHVLTQGSDAVARLGFDILEVSAGFISIPTDDALRLVGRVQRPVVTYPGGERG
jgi:hypothetical protein